MELMVTQHTTTTTTTLQKTKVKYVHNKKKKEIVPHAALRASFSSSRGMSAVVETIIFVRVVETIIGQKSKLLHSSFFLTEDKMFFPTNTNLLQYLPDLLSWVLLFKVVLYKY